MKIKLNKKVNIILAILEIVCVIVIIKYYFFNNIDLIKSINFSSNNKDELYINIAVGYLCSYIFYVLQIYLPEKYKKRKFYQKNNSEISDIVNEIEELLVCMQSFYKWNESNLFSIDRNSVVVMIVNEDNNKIYWSTKILKSEFGNYFDNLIKKIEKIKADSLYAYIDIETMECFEMISKKCLNINKLLNSLKLNSDLSCISCELYKDEKAIESCVKELKKIKRLDTRTYKIASKKEEDIFEKVFSREAKNIKLNGKDKLYVKVDYNKEEVQE